MKRVTWIFCCVLALTSTAYAQQEPSDEADNSTQDASDQTLEEVLVVAQRTQVATKTDALITEIPQSISVVSAETITDIGAVNFEDVFRYTAGVNAGSSGEDVRGDFASARGFSLVQYLDGLNRQPDFLYGSRMEIYTLERAEVLKGPSSVLYGAGSAGGLLNAVSKRPKYEFGADVGLQVGNFDRRELTADVTGPFSESFAGRLVGVWRDGELLSPGEKNDKLVLMPSITWRPGDRTELTFIGLWMDEDLGTQTYVPARKTAYANAAAGDPPIPHNSFLGEPGFNHMKADQLAYTLLFTHRFNDTISFTSNNRYIDQDTDYAEVYLSTSWVDEARTTVYRQFYVLDETYSVLNSDSHVQFDFETGSWSHQLLVAIDYTEFEQDRKEGFSCRGWPYPPCWPTEAPPLNVYDPVYGIPFTYGFTNAYKTKSTQLGYYVQDQIKVGDRLSIVLGARRDRSTSRATSSPEDSQNADTYRAGIIWEVLDGFSPFVSYSEGFQPVFGGDFYGQPYKPQESNQLEFGVKWQPNANSLVTVSYYDIEETNFLSADPENIQNFLQAGSIGATGYEIEAKLNLPYDFGLMFSYSDTDAKVTESTATAVTGDRVPGIPEKLASVWLDKEFFANRNLTWRAGVGVRYIGDKIDFLQKMKTPSATLGDAMVEATYMDDWSFLLNITNFTDKEWYAQCTADYGGAPLPEGHCYVGYTRMINFTIRKRF